MDLNNVQWGPISGWVAALLTVFALYMSLRIYKRDQIARRQAQASKVNAWIDTVDIDDLEVSVDVLNGSDAPVYNVYIAVYTLASSHPFVYAWQATRHFGSLGPSKSSHHFAMKVKGDISREFRNPPLSISRAVVGIHFVDTFGVKWSRGPDGRLKGGRSRFRRWLSDLYVENIVLRYGQWPSRRKTRFGRWISYRIMLPKVWMMDGRRGGWRYRVHPLGMEYKRSKFSVGKDGES